MSAAFEGGNGAFYEAAGAGPLLSAAFPSVGANRAIVAFIALSTYGTPPTVTAISWTGGGGNDLGTALQTTLFNTYYRNQIYALAGTDSDAAGQISVTMSAAPDECFIAGASATSVASIGGSVSQNGSSGTVTATPPSVGADDLMIAGGYGGPYNATVAPSGAGCTNIYESETNAYNAGAMVYRLGSDGTNISISCTSAPHFNVLAVRLVGISGSPTTINGALESLSLSTFAADVQLQGVIQAALESMVITTNQATVTGGPTTITALEFASNGETDSDCRLVWADADGNMVPRTNHTVIKHVKYKAQNGYYANDWHSQFNGAFLPGNDEWGYGTHPFPSDGSYNSDGANIWSGDYDNHSVQYFEIADSGNDYLSIPSSEGTQEALILETGKWYVQMRTSEIIGSYVHMTYWPDLVGRPDFKIHRSKLVTAMGSTPSAPAFYHGASDWTNQGGTTNSEAFSGYLRKIMHFNAVLSEADGITEALSEKDEAQTAAGIASIWYSNTNPTVADTSDKSGQGHDPYWDGGVTATDYSESVVDINAALESLLLTANAASIASSTSISGALESLALVVNSATVSLGVSISGALEALALTANPASIDAGTDIAAALETIVLTGYTANVSADTAIAAALQSLLLTANQASINAGSNINANTESLQLTVNQASVSAGNTVNAAQEAIALSTFQSTISTGLVAQTEALTLGTFLATISSNRAIQGQVEALTLSTNPASLALGSQINTALESIQIVTNPATITLDVGISAALESILLTQLSAQVVLSQNIDAQLESLTITPYGATLVLDTGIIAALEGLTLSAFDAVLTIPTGELTAPGLGYTLKPNKLHFTFKR